MISLATNWPIFVGAFLLLLALMHIALVCLWPLNSRQWKKTDYIWLSMSLIGVLLMIETVRLEIRPQQATATLNYVRSSFFWVTREIKTFQPNMLCREFTRSPFSPDDFDQIVLDYEEACDWSKNLQDEFPVWDEENLPLIDESFANAASYSSPYVARALSEMEPSIIEYKKQRAIYEAILDESKPSDAAFLLRIFSPLLLGFAIALRITKITGELKHGAP